MDESLTRSIGFSLLLSIMLISTPGTLHCQLRLLDSLSLARAQVYLDSLWTVYAAAGNGPEQARTRMLQLLDEWAANRNPEEAAPNHAVEVCREVYSDIFHSRYYSDTLSPEEQRFVPKVKTPYLLIPDSIWYCVIDDSTTWATVSGRAGTRKARNARLYYPDNAAKFVPDLEMPATIIHIEQAQYEALNCFINGEKTAIEGSTEQSPTRDRFEWLLEFLPLCRSHDGNFYPIYSDPRIGVVALNHDYTEAVVTISTRCYHGEKWLCRFVDGMWKRIESYDHYDI